MSTVLKPFIELPYGTKFRYQGSEEVWVRTQHNVIAGWSPNLIQYGHQSLCAFCALEGDEDGNTLQTLVEVVGDQPAQQHHGEPAALPERHVHEHHGCFLSERQHGWNACLDEIAKLGPLYTRPVQGEPVAWQDPDNDSRMCTAEHKAYALSKGGAPAAALATLTRPLYTRADPGEVERLRIALGNTQALLDQANYHKAQRGDAIDTLSAQLKQQRAEFAKAQVLEHSKWAELVDDLRAQLAERDALLREAHDLINSGYLGSHDSRTRRLAGNLRDRIKATLSASAEPSAMTERIKSAACSTCASHPCACAELSVPVKRDERADFDAAYERGDFYLEEQRSEVKYQDYRRHQAWAVWQVRAALERKP